MKVGEVTRVKWYVFEDDPQVYSFHTALYDNGEIVILRSDRDTWPGQLIDAGYKLMRNSTDVEVDTWLNSHHEIRLDEIVEV